MSKAKEEYNRDGIEKLKKLAREQFDADLEAVIRCGDCKRWLSIKSSEYGFCLSDDFETISVMPRRGFCSRAERKEE